MKDGLYYAHLLHPSDKGVVRRNAGRFIVKGDKVHHLEDYFGLLNDQIPEGAVDDYIEHRISNPGPKLSVASHGDIASGKRLDFIPELPLETPLPKEEVQPKRERPPSVWHYTRAGHDRPHLLEAKDGQFLLDGNPLKDNELHTILQNVKTKVAKLRYPKSPVALTKAEGEIASLMKASEEEMGPDEALAHLSSLHNGDEKTTRALASVRKHLFTDPMTGMGNKLAYTQFREKQKPGAYVSLDANNFKSLNDTYGHDTGDAAIKAYGQAMRDAAKEAGDAKLFRAGGDELFAHFPTVNHAHQFLRSLRGKLEAIPPVNGTHRLSLSAGVGHTFQNADSALYEAKKKKVGHTPVSIPHLLTHSVHPDAPEGPVAPTPSAV